MEIYKVTIPPLSPFHLILVTKMETGDISKTVFLVAMLFLTLFIMPTIYLLYNSYSGFVKCRDKEHINCPAFNCPNYDDINVNGVTCRWAAFRIEDGVKECSGEK